MNKLRTGKIAIGLNLYVNDMKALEWVYGKLSTRVALFCIFEIKNFQDFEFETSTTSCHHIAKINKQDGERS